MKGVQIYAKKCIKIRLAAGLRPHPLEGANALLQTP